MSGMERLQKLLQRAASTGPALVGAAGLAGAGYLATNAMYTVDAGHMSLKYSRMSGVGNSTYREGVHFLIPWFERPIIFDVRARPHTMTSLTGSRDLQMVNISLRALCKPDAAKLPEIYRTLGLDFDEKVLPSIINEVLKSVVAQYNASQLITQRELVSRMIRQRLIQRAAEFGMLLDDVAITHLNFSPEYEKVASALTASIEVLLHAPYYTYDFFASTNWNVSLYDMAVNLDSERNYKSFAEYEDMHVLPGPRLEPWHSVPLRPFGAVMLSALPPALRIAMLQFHDGSALELLSSTKAALRSLSGVQNVEPTIHEVRLYFTQVKALRNTEMGKWLAQHVVADFATLKAMFQDLQDGQMSMEEVGKVWLPKEARGLEDAEIVICSEPMWLCPYIRPRRTSAMLGVLHMALLNEFPTTRPEDVWSFWSGFKSTLEERRLLPSAACRITVEQVAHQSGWELPYVPVIGLGIDARYSPGLERRALVFRNNRQNTLAFRSALRMFVDSIPNFPVQVLDMNDIKRALSFHEIAEFHCVIILPHGPNALRLSDVYAATIPTVVPEEPLVQNFIWSSRTFGGYDAEMRYLDRAPEALRANQFRPTEFHPTNYLQSWSVHRFIDDRRYWYRYTEWATLPHLLRFGSVPALLHLLEDLTAQRGLEVSAKMARHHVSMAADALSWWRLALADALN